MGKLNSLDKSPLAPLFQGGESESLEFSNSVIYHPNVLGVLGFTLLEVVITLTLLGILLAIVTLQLSPLLSQTALREATRQMVANLQYVRMKAVSQNRRLRVTFRPVIEDYIVDKDEEGVWQRQLLASHSAEAVADATIPLPRGVRIAAVNSGGDIIFLPRGAVDGGISITLGTANGPDTRRVVVNLAGRVRVE